MNYYTPTYVLNQINAVKRVRELIQEERAIAMLETEQDFGDGTISKATAIRLYLLDEIESLLDGDKK